MGPLSWCVAGALLCWSSGQEAEVWTRRWSLLNATDAEGRPSALASPELSVAPPEPLPAGVEGLRWRLLAAGLEQRRSNDSLLAAPARVAATDLPARWLPGEALVAARCLEAGDARAAAFEEALRGALADTELFPALSGAFDAFVEDETDFRGPEARRIAEAMYARAPAPWSVFCLEGIVRRLGDYDRADEVLAEQVAAAPDAGAECDLLSGRAIVAIAAGSEAAGRRYLGAALARSGGGVPPRGNNALQVLGKLELDAGRSDRARTLFGALLERAQRAGTDPDPWALKGWGVALLPPAPAGPRVRGR